ncbi:MAG: adenylate/guanylate cyclase domain-containing protein [Alphaproteobacteria bacterium]
MRITSGLMISFGGLVLLATLLVLWLGLWSTRQNTLELVRDQAALMLELLHQRIVDELRPAEQAVNGIARQIEGGQIDVDDPSGLAQAMRGVMIGATSLNAMIYVSAIGDVTRIVLDGDELRLSQVNEIEVERVRAGLAEAAPRTRAYWGEIVRPPEANVSLINVRRPILVDGVFVGVAVATVIIDRLSRRLDDIGTEVGGVPFLIDDAGRVVAHRFLRGGYVASSPERPLPPVDGFGDPVLVAFADPAQHMDAGSRFERDAGVKIVRTRADADYVILAEPLAGFSKTPWIAGVYFPVESVNAVYWRMVWAGGAGLAVVALALLVAWLLARYLARPILALAAAAIEVRDLELGKVRPLSGSVFRELDDAGSAFNAMVVGLRWFEFYVPRQLVRRLVQQGDTATGSEQREITVMFTDMAGFTSVSEELSAAATAALLNQHFALLATCIEAEGGTIDKFIGDSVMAFWGAPEDQPDHAGRAVRAALAIRQAVAQDNHRRAQAGAPTLSMRIGLHAGPAVVGNIGSPDRINYTIVGDTVNVASRLEQMGKSMDARPADHDVRILASADTVSAAGVDGDSVGSQPVRGRHDPVAVYRL